MKPITAPLAGLPVLGGNTVACPLSAVFVEYSDPPATFVAVEPPLVAAVSVSAPLFRLDADVAVVVPCAPPVT